MCLAILSGQRKIIFRRIKSIVRKVIRILDLFHRLDIRKCIFHILHTALRQCDRGVRRILPGIILFYKGHLFPRCFFILDRL